MWGSKLGSGMCWHRIGGSGTECIVKGHKSTQSSRRGEREDLKRLSVMFAGGSLEKKQTRQARHMCRDGTVKPVEEQSDSGTDTDSEERKI